MDVTSVLTPGTQALVSAILTDSWTQARSAIARLWARHTTSTGAAESESMRAVQIESELESAYQRSLTLTANSSADERPEGLRLFWTGYLLGQMSAQPSLVEAVGALPTLLHPDGTAPRTSTVANRITGTVNGNVIMGNDFTGDVRLG